MFEEKLALHVESLKLSEETLKMLKIIGIIQLEDFNVFNLEEINMLFGDSFEEIKTILIRYALPRNLENLNLRDEIVQILKGAKIHDLKELLDFDINALHHLFVEFEYFPQDLNNILELYEFDTPKDQGCEHKIKSEFVDRRFIQEHPVIDFSNRICSNIQPIRNEDGSLNYKHVIFCLASSKEIRRLSYGEIKNDETINLGTMKPEVGGLFCERIFGPTRDYECSCGKKQASDKGQICKKCNIEINDSKVRGERIGHIELGIPVVHPLFLHEPRHVISMLLNLDQDILVKIVYYESFIVIDSDIEVLSKRQILSLEECTSLYNEYGNTFIALSGADAIKRLLQDLNLDNEVSLLRNVLNTNPEKVNNHDINRLKIIEEFINSNSKTEEMVMDVIPVIPPDLRPIRFIEKKWFTGDLINKLYKNIFSLSKSLKGKKEGASFGFRYLKYKRNFQEDVVKLYTEYKKIA